VSGWRRAWRKSPLRDRCFLTVVPALDDYVEGLIAAVPGAVYAIPEGAHHDPGDDNPVLLSYIDVVVQGFLAEFGPDGARHFFDTTQGWHVPVLDDRAAPIYARAQGLDEAERAVVDEGLARVGARIVGP